MDKIKEIKEAIIKFREEREWRQFHNAKDLSIALNIESSELLELFLWKDPETVSKNKVKEELADILNYAFLMAIHYDFDIRDIILEKIKSNEKKYPIEKSKGSSKKYNEL